MPQAPGVGYVQNRAGYVPSFPLGTMDGETDNVTLTHDGTRIERISTGALPSDSEVRTVVTVGYERYRSLGEGTVASYIPALAQAAPTAFGVCVAGVRGDSLP